jgi:hypothetical protein
MIYRFLNRAKKKKKKLKLKLFIFREMASSLFRPVAVAGRKSAGTKRRILI